MGNAAERITNSRSRGAAGKVVAVFPKHGFGSLTSDFEILRGDFARVLFDATRDTSEYRFGTHVTGLEETEDDVRATFADGATEAFELVICADGMSSSTRSQKTTSGPAP